MDNNVITVTGNVTRDPELKFLNSGQAAIRVSIAVNRRWQNRQTQEWEEKVSYFEVVGYGSMAENAAGSLNKGDRAVVSGRLEQRSWVTEAGEKRSVVEINADEIAPSLRFATAVVTRTPRQDATPREPARFGREHGRHAPPARQPEAAAYDEEPF